MYIKMKRILVVDDERDTNLFLKIVLENENSSFKVDSFDNPILALKNFRKNLYELLILDIRMSQMNGIKLYQEIRKIDNKVKVCFLTAGQSYYRAFTDICHDLKENRFIQKPIENEELVKRINEIISSN
jgi:DNA-binding response OmpR family regulator